MVHKKSNTSMMMDEDSLPETDVSKEFLNFFTDQIKDIYWSEKHLTKALPKLQRAATSAGLKNAFAVHLSATKLHVERLEQVFELLGENPRVKKCEAMAGLVEEAYGIIDETDKGSNLRDAGIVLAAQRLEHYEIATYGGLVQFARTMGNEDIITLLEETLLEEKKTDEFFTVLAENGINDSAATEGMEKQQEDIEEVATEYDSVNLTKKNTKKD